jgi:hypothetical protein
MQSMERCRANNVKVDMIECGQTAKSVPAGMESKGADNAIFSIFCYRGQRLFAAGPEGNAVMKHSFM